MMRRIRHKRVAREPPRHKKGLARAACSSLDRHDFGEQVTPTMRAGVKVDKIQRTDERRPSVYSTPHTHAAPSV
jgi:hypothetical protein